MRTKLFRALKPRHFVIALALLVVGCESDAIGPAGLPGGVEIRAAAPTFDIATINGEKTSVVSARIVNNGLSTIWVHYCGARIYKRADNDWVEVWAENCAAVNGIFSELKPSGVTVVSRQLANPATPFSFGGPFTFELGVYYRISVPLLKKTGDGPNDFQLINPRETMSTTFAFTL